jgi:hypothetical protein
MHQISKTIQKIAIELICLHPMVDRSDKVCRRAFSTARHVVETETNTKIDDNEFEKLYRKWATPK